jgi:hypothetical protein
VQKISRKFSMVVVIVVAALAVLALVTQAGVLLRERAHPPRAGWSRWRADPPHRRYRPARRGRPADRDAAWRKFQSRGDAAAGRGTACQKHRVILIDRPGHGWSTRVRLEDSTPEIQARMIEEALAKLGVTRRSLWCIPGPARWARASRWITRKPSPAW